tara:strand:+ start:680 stop:1126 length:447 start_codon:yes stop_codon:yes gene_type:complete
MARKAVIDLEKEEEFDRERAEAGTGEEYDRERAEQEAEEGESGESSSSASHRHAEENSGNTSMSKSAGGERSDVFQQLRELVQGHKHKEVVKVLRKCPQVMNETDEAGRTLLHIAGMNMLSPFSFLFIDSFKSNFESSIMHTENQMSL